LTGDGGDGAGAGERAGPVDGFFGPLAAHLGSAYLRYSFTKGTDQEVGFLVGALGLGAGARVLDVGCGPGRHALALGRRGISVVGVDQSPEFVALGAEAAAAEGLPCRFVVGDARSLGAALAGEAPFDAAMSICQGAFGLLGADPDGDRRVLGGMVGAVRPGGRLAVSAFNAYFAVSGLEAGESFDAVTGTVHERTAAKGADGSTGEFDLWTTTFTPRELRLLAEVCGLAVDAVHGVAPGRYGAAAPSIDLPEHLLLAHRPG
jgi:SAM-dependent methyltransferase